MEMKVVMKDPKKSDYFYEEAIKNLRTNIQFLGKQTKIILFASCYPNEGKSDIAFTLSVEMGKTGKRVLLIDADIRKSNYVRRFHVSEKVVGLSQYLSGQIEMGSIIYQTNYEHMDMVFAGPTAPNPSELLNDPEFEKLLNEIKDDYEYIFIDTPPALNLTDATVVARYCDGGILVVEAEAVSYKIAQKVKAQLERSGCPILGAVLNKVDVQKRKYYKSYYRKGYHKK